MKAIVYQFTMYEAASDNMVKSRRWGTRDAIERIQGFVLEETATEVDVSVLGRQYPGLSEIGFDPHSLQGFQTRVTR